LAAVRSAVRVATNHEMAPRGASARQVLGGLRRVVRLRSAPPVRDDVVVR
ncbi:hypothetical protein HGA02_12120, partial [Cellulomonas septica]|nr:hypothetical protein [Cellulomonas septica]